MVYKKYIKRKVNGETRLFGPYYYESYRDKSGKVKTRYIAGPEDNYLGAKDTEKNHSGKRKKAFKIVLISLLVVLILGFVFVQIYQSLPSDGFSKVIRIQEKGNSISGTLSNAFNSAYKTISGFVFSEEPTSDEQAVQEEPEQAEVPLEELTEPISEEQIEEILTEQSIEESSEANIAEEILNETVAEPAVNDIIINETAINEIIIEPIANETIINVNETITNIIVNITETNQTIPVEEKANETLINETIANITLINQTLTNLTNIILINETISNLTLANITETNQSLKNQTFNITTKRARIVLNRPVKWIKTVKLNSSEVGGGDLTINIPLNAENITIKTGEEVGEAEQELEDYEQIVNNADREEISQGTLTGLVSLEIKEKQGIITRFWNWLTGFTITGNIISEQELEQEQSITETSDSKIVNITNIAETTQEQDLAVEYYTPAPTASEENLSRGKKITISAADELNYTDILAYTEIPNNIKNENNKSIKLYQYVFEETEIVEQETEPEISLEETDSAIIEENQTQENVEQLFEEQIEKINETSEIIESTSHINESQENPEILEENKSKKTKDEKPEKEKIENNKKTEIIQGTIKNQTSLITGNVIQEEQNNTEISVETAQPKFTKQEVEFDAYDLDEDGFIDYIEWNVPHLSEQVYEIIYITKAEHLDENYTVIEEVYDYVNEKDDNWTLIPDEHYIRATFEEPLDKTRDITLYARGNNSQVKVYRENDNALVALFENISAEDWYKIYLINLGDNESYSTLDLKSIGSVEYDYIVDPQANLSGTIFRCGTIDSPGTYTVNQTITFSVGTCITINSDDVFLEGNYRTMNTTSSGNTGISASGKNNITIQKFYIYNMSTAIYLSDTYNSSVLNNYIYGGGPPGPTYYGIYLSTAVNCNVSKNTANNHGPSGGIGIYLGDIKDSFVTGNTASNNQNTGIYVSGNNNTITGNTATYQQAVSTSPISNAGIYVSGSNNTVNFNTASYNAQIYGISIAGNNNSIINNPSVDYNYYGIYSSGNNDTIQNNIVSNNQWTGISVSGNNTLITNNTANLNNASGISVAADLSTISSNTVSNCSVSSGTGGCLAISGSENLVYANSVIASRGNVYGIYVTGSNNTLFKNTANSQGYSGIYITGNANNLSSNTANNNSQSGIYITGGNNNLTNNVARLNGWYGFYLANKTDLFLNNTAVSTSVRPAVYLSGSSNNTLFHSSFNSTLNYSIYLTGNSVNNTLINTTLKGSLGDYADAGSELIRQGYVSSINANVTFYADSSPISGANVTLRNITNAVLASNMTKADGTTIIPYDISKLTTFYVNTGSRTHYLYLSTTATGYLTETTTFDWDNLLANDSYIDGDNISVGMHGTTYTVSTIQDLHQVYISINNEAGFNNVSTASEPCHYASNISLNVTGTLKIDGCILEMSNPNELTISVDSTGTLIMNYSNITSYKSTEYYNFYSIRGSSLILNNSYINHVGTADLHNKRGLTINSTNVIFNNITMYKNQRSLELLAPNLTIQNSKFYGGWDLDVGDHIVIRAPGERIVNCNISEPGLTNSDIAIDANMDVSVINSNFSSVGFQTGGLLYRKWYYQAYVNGTDGNPISSANVTAYNLSNSYQFNLTTNASGFTPNGEIIEYIQNSSGYKHYYSNYTIYAGANRFSTENNTHNITIERNIHGDVFTLTWVNPNVTDCLVLNVQNKEYILNKSISATATCMNITANNITLNLDGYTISGDANSPEDYGVFIQGSNNTQVINGYITNFGAGVYSNKGNNGNFSYLNITSSGNFGFGTDISGISLINSQNNFITYNNLSSLSNTGGASETFGIYLSGSSNNTILKNKVNSNYAIGVGYGLYLTSSHNNTIINNTANSNWAASENAYGFYSISSNSNNFIDNYAGSNKKEGFSITGSNNTLVNNTAYINSRTGIGVYGSNNTLVNNTAYYSSNIGIDISGSQNTLIGNIIQLTSGNAAVYLLSGNNNKILNNSITGNSEEGIYLNFCNVNLISGNNISQNSLNGIYIISSSNNTLTGNVIYKNGGLSEDGVVIENSNNNSIRGNIISNSSDDGLNLKGTSLRNNIISNNITLNKGKGVLINDNCNGTIVSYNNISHNLDDGIDINQAMHNNVTNNIIERNGNGTNGDGISSDGGDYNRFINNTIIGNSDDGLELDDNSTDNFVMNNTLNSNNGDGFHMEVNSVRNTIQNNTVSFNLDDGLQIQNSSSHNLITLNVVNSNQDHGIKITNNATNNTFSYNIINGSGRNPEDTGDGFNIQTNSNRVFNNTVSYGSDDGIKISANYTLVENNTILYNNDKSVHVIGGKWNNITNNYASFNSHGYVLQDNSTNNTLVNNKAVNNSQQGFYIRSSLDIQNTFTNSYACCNYGDYDIYDKDSSIFTSSTCGTFNLGSCDTSCPDTCTGACNYAVSSSTQLTQDYNCMSTGFIITAGNITFDCQNRSIRGANQDHSGIIANSIDNVTIQNCFISNFEEGVYFNNTGNSFIQDNILRLNKAGFRFRYGLGNSAINNTLTGNDDGIQIQSSSGNNIFNNTIDNNLDDGSQIELASNSNVFIGNSIRNNFDNGIKFETSSINNTLFNNTITNNSRDIAIELDSLRENNFTNISLEIRRPTYGIISWNPSLSFNYSNLSEAITISANSIFVNSSKIPALNTSANLTIYSTNSLGFSDRYPLREGTTCPSSICTEITDADTYVFKVTQFTTYSVGGTTSGTTPGTTPGGGGGGSAGNTTCTPDCSQASNFCQGTTFSDGCNGTCSGTQVCCVPYCIGKSCGDNGCGGSCGSCSAGQNCILGKCYGGTEIPLEMIRTGSSGCSVNMECGNWSECEISYNLDILLQGAESLSGAQKRLCEDKNKCVNSVFEERTCKKEILISVKRSTWCNGDYIEIYDKNNILSSRIKKTEFENIKKLDIELILSGFKGYCYYCYDNVQNYDETGVDCGGSCISCDEKSGEMQTKIPFANSIYIILIGIIMGFAVLWICSLIWKLYSINKIIRKKKSI